MKKIAVPLTFVAFLALVFVLGLVNQSLWLITPAFCLWTPGVFWLGYAFSKAGKFTFGFTPDEAAATTKQHKQRQSAGQAYQ